METLLLDKIWHQQPNPKGQIQKGIKEKVKSYNLRQRTTDN